MRILFDIEIKNSNVYTTCSPEEIIGFNTIKKYISDRLSVLADEIQMEEDSIIIKKAAIVVYITKTPRGIQPRNYSDNLTEKILMSFVETDIELMWHSVDDAIKRFLN